jgi:hypothetical protein
MTDLAPLTDLLLTAGLLAISIVPLVWLSHGSETPVGSPFGIRFDASSPPVPEEVDPPRWRIEPIGERTQAPGQSDPSPVVQPLPAAQPSVPLSSGSAHAE